MKELEIERLYQNIKRDAAEIMKASEDGCSKAQNVIAMHRMCVTSADAPTVALLSCAYIDYCNTKPQSEG